MSASQNRFLLPQPGSSASNQTAASLDQADQENQLSVDTDFDSYWEEEARNPHRNRIRIGRQYQATVPQLLKSGDKDNRRLEDLETLTFCPKKFAKITDKELDNYFSVAKSIVRYSNRIPPEVKNEEDPVFKMPIVLKQSKSSSQSLTQAQNQPSQSQSQSQNQNGIKAKAKSIDARMSVYNFDEELKEDSPLRLECPKPGTEVKPLKAKPIVPNVSSDATEATNSNVGSLKFFMDGQLVLKLNACQEQQEGTEKCHWVQSGDKIATTGRQKRFTKRAERPESQQDGSRSDSVLSSFQDDDSKHGDLSGDDDSKESTNSCTSLSRQLQTNQPRSPTPKRLKIKNEPSLTQGQSPSPVNYNRSHANNRVTEPHEVVNHQHQTTPVMNPAMPWIPNSFAMAAALLTGLPFQQSAGNLINATQQNKVNNLNITSKPMDLSVEHSVHKPPKSSSRSRSRQRNNQ